MVGDKKRERSLGSVSSVRQDLKKHPSLQQREPQSEN